MSGKELPVGVFPQVPSDELRKMLEDKKTRRKVGRLIKTVRTGLDPLRKVVINPLTPHEALSRLIQLNREIEKNSQ